MRRPTCINQEAYNALYDKAAAALETGNHKGALEVLATAIECFPREVTAVRLDLESEYQVNL